MKNDINNSTLLKAVFLMAALPMLFVGTLFAQSGDPLARAQIIHNSADPAAEVVDIYVNGGLFVDSLAFRAATPFVDVPADTPLLIEIYPHGADASATDAAFTLEGAEFPGGGTFTVIANGLLADGFAANPDGIDTEFNLYILPSSEMHNTSGETTFFIWHGATDAPGVDVFARGVAQLADDLQYTDNTDYIVVPSEDYTVDVAPTGGDVIASFTAPLSTLDGEALGVLASGFLDSSANNDGEAFGLLAVLADGTTLMLPAADLPEPEPVFARAQIIHNSADPAAAVVDIYANGGILVDSLAFRAATPFVDVPADTPLLIEIYPYGADPSATDAAFTLEGAEFPEGGTFTVIANGLLADGFAANPEGIETAFNLYVLPSSESHEDSGESSFYIWHGATDAPGVDVFARDVAQLADDLQYTGNTDFITVPAADYTVDVAPAGADVIASFTAPLSGLGGEALGVLASGFLDPSANNNGEAFGLLAVLADGTTLMLPAADLPDPEPETFVTWHFENPEDDISDERTAGFWYPERSFFSVDETNSFSGRNSIAVSYDPAALGGNQDDNFRMSFDNVHNIGVRPQQTLRVHVYVPVEAADKITRIDLYDMWDRREFGDPEPGQSNFAYQSTNYSVSDDLTPGEWVELTHLIDRDVTKQTLARIGVRVNIDTGYTGDAPMVLVDFVTTDPDAEPLERPIDPEPEFARAQIVHNAADPAAEVVDIYVNGGLFVDSLAFRAATPFVDVPGDTPLLIEIYPHGADTSATDAAFTLDGAEFPLGGTFTVIANGLLADGFAANPEGIETAFNLYVLPSSESHENSGESSFYIWHGATDAPGVDVFARDVAQLADDLQYTGNTDFITVPAADYTVDVAPAGADVIASFTAPLSGLGGQAFGVLASGFLDPSANNDGEAFGLLAVLADGTTLMLPAADLPAETFSVTFNVDMRPADNFDPETQHVFISGSMVGWDQPGSNLDAKMEPVSEGSNVYTITFDLEAGDYAYKYFLVPSDVESSWDFGEWDGDPNRTLTVNEDVVVNDFFGIQPGEPIIARAQIIHNAADPAAEVVDIYVNGGLFVDSLAFRAATPFVDVPASVGLTIEIYGHGADPSETDPAFTLEGAEFEPFETYAVIANGVIADGFAANPDEVETAFNLFVLPAWESHGNSEEVAFYIWHGSTDAPAVDVFARDVAQLADGLAYTDATDYIAVPAADYTVDLTPAGASDVVASFVAPLEGAGGSAFGVLASGFFDPAGNNDGPAFGLLAVFADGSTVLLPAALTSSEPMVDLPTTFRLEQNYPNPFNPTTRIEFSVPETSNVTLEVFNIQGQRVATLVDGTRDAGVHTVSFDAANLASGVYLYRIQAGNFTQVNKMMLVK